MTVFVYADLVYEPGYAYQKPLLTKICQEWPHLLVLDIDSYSGEFLVSQACRLAGQADICAVCFSSPDATNHLGTIMPLAESIIRRQQNSLVILQGFHTRLERLFQNRPNLVFLHNPSNDLLLAHLKKFCD